MRTDPNAPPGEQMANNVTLLVKPEDAERIELLASSARIRLLLRNGRDKTKSESDGITLAELKGGNRDGMTSAPVQTALHTSDPFADSVAVTTPTTQPTKQDWTVEIIRAGQPSSQKFEIPVKPQPELKPAEPKKDEPKTGSFVTQIGSIFGN